MTRSIEPASRSAQGPLRNLQAAGRRAFVVASLTGSLAFTLVCCGGEGDPAGAGSAKRTQSEPGSALQVVCTTTMIGDLVREVAGDMADVHVLFGPTVDPHLFRATRDDVALLMGADLVFSNGFGLEGYLEPTLTRVRESGIDLVEVVPTILKEGEALDNAGTPDPHVWMDPSLWMRVPAAAAHAIGEELSAADKEAGGAALAERARSVEAGIAKLDAAAAAAIEAIPDGQRILVTAHDAFGYFGRRYALQVEAIQGLSTASESGLQAIESLVDLLVTAKVPAVFFESTVSERNIRALVEGAAARGHTVAIGGVLHSDAPGAAGTYSAMIEHNIATIATSLGGEAKAASQGPRR